MIFTLPCLLNHYSQYPRHGNNLNTHHWMNGQIEVVYIHIRIFSHEKEQPVFVTKWVDLEHIMLGKINQTEKYNYYMILIICGL